MEKCCLCKMASTSLYYSENDKEGFCAKCAIEYSIKHNKIMFNTHGYDKCNKCLIIYYIYPNGNLHFTECSCDESTI